MGIKIKKNANGVCEHCRSLGLTADMMSEHPLQKVGNLASHTSTFTQRVI
jgi:hypothetical protein